ncbi:unnamed protein product [Phaedon cochleariae]|uniref:Apolipoprotein L3 n=1 Tax=Phaedon cochleariae TaxID=80249 RepID=A0A9N9SIM1_PHACE|nr:unnamed protein product [Phaedon cochleariae]
MGHNSKASSNNFKDLLQNYIEKLEEIVGKLHDLRQTIASHHKTCNIAKTAGTAVSGTGVAIVVGSVLSAPFTGGSTLAVGAGGAVMSVTGGISNVITDYVDYRTTTMIMADIENIVKSKETFDENLSRQLKHFGMVIDNLISTGVDKDSAIVIAVKAIANGCIDLTEEPNMKLMNTLSTIIKLHHVESAALETLPIIGRTMHMSEKSFQFIYVFFGLTGQTGAAVFKTIGRISSVISIAFTIVDIAILVKDWTTEHPTVEVVLETERKIEEERRILVDLLEVLENSKDEVEDVWMRILKEIEDIEEKELAFEHDFVIVNNDIEVES